LISLLAASVCNVFLDFFPAYELDAFSTLMQKAPFPKEIKAKVRPIVKDHLKETWGSNWNTVIGNLEAFA